MSNPFVLKATVINNALVECKKEFKAIVKESFGLVLETKVTPELLVGLMMRAAESGMNHYSDEIHKHIDKMTTKEIMDELPKSGAQ